MTIFSLNALRVNGFNGCIAARSVFQSTIPALQTRLSAKFVTEQDSRIGIVAMHSSNQALENQNDTSKPAVNFMRVCGQSQVAVESLFSMTFPSYHELLVRRSRELEEATSNIHAWYVTVGSSDPVALAVAQEEEGTGRAELLSVFVKPSQRRKGLATTLLTHLQSSLRATGSLLLYTRFTSSLQYHQAFAGLLKRLEWEEPNPRYLFCRGSVAKFVETAEWMTSVVCPEEFRVSLWQDISPTQRSAIRENIAEGLVPDELSPFYQEDLIEPLSSTALSLNGSVIGWQINHIVPNEPGVVRYSRTFVMPVHQRMGRAVLPMVESIRRNLAHAIDEYPEFVSDVPYELPRMVAFYKRRLVPHSRVSYSSYHSQKVLRG